MAPRLIAQIWWRIEITVSQLISCSAQTRSRVTPLRVAEYGKYRVNPHMGPATFYRKSGPDGKALADPIEGRGGRDLAARDLAWDLAWY